jgi:hypothetical protein
MREIVIHLGPPKTGSSAIQTALHGYRDATTRYASFKESNHSRPIVTIFSKKGKSHRFYKDYGFIEEEIAELKKIYKAQLEFDLNDAYLERLIISGEGIFSLEADEIKEMLNFFKSRNWRCKIFLFARNPIDLIASRVNQNIKKGRNDKHFSIHFKKNLSRFIENLGPQNINVFDYSNLVQNNNNIVDFVSKFLNISVKTNTIVNESSSLEATAIAYKLNITPINFIGNPNRIKARQKIVNEARLYFSLNKGFKKPDPLIFTGLAKKETVEEYCKWLTDSFSIRYNFNVYDYKEQNLYKYFNNALSRIPELLKDFFLHFQVNYDTSISMDKNFTNLFVNQIEKFPTSISNEYLHLYNSLSEYNKKLKIKNLNFNRRIVFYGSFVRILKSIILKLKIIFLKI